MINFGTLKWPRLRYHKPDSGSYPNRAVKMEDEVIMKWQDSTNSDSNGRRKKNFVPALTFAAQ